VPVLHAWGMTETTPVASVCHVKSSLGELSEKDRFGVIAKQGLAVLGVDLTIMDEEGNEVPWDGTSFGEIVVRGPWVTGGYLHVDAPERFTNGWYENMLVQQWLPLMPDVQERLTRGVSVADIGCGRGRGIIKLAQSFPCSRYVGYDVFQPTIDRANANAQAAGVADRVRFQHLDASHDLPEQYDVITTFDVVHDAADPRGMLRSIRKALRPDGRYLCLEINAAETVEGNAGPLGTLFYGFSILYCMTTSLHNHGEGLGTVGLPESKVRELCIEVGFSSVQRAPIENPFNSFFVAIP